MRGTGQSENKLSDSMTFSDHLEALELRTVVIFTPITAPSLIPRGPNNPRSCTVTLTRNMYCQFEPVGAFGSLKAHLGLI